MLFIHQLENIEDEQYKDSTTILQLLKENIDMWKAHKVKMKLFMIMKI